MGALPPISPWIPEDDLLLKNAVEAGASLVSLAKGAVRFSRSFTIQELQERWHSLLYNPEISIESAENMIGLERAASNVPLNKSSKMGTLKIGGEGQKRKLRSVRNYYYAFHKRIRSDPLNQGDLDLPVPPVESFCGHGNDAANPSNILEDPAGNHLGTGNDNFVCHENIDGASHEFGNQGKDHLENNPIEKHREMPQMALGGNSTAAGGIDSLKEISVQNLLEDNIDANTFKSPVLECEASLHNLQYSSPPAMHVWRNTNTMSEMDLAGDSHFIGETEDTGDPFGLPNEARKSPSDYEIVHSGANYENHIPCEDMKASSSCAQYDLGALDTLLDLSDYDMPLMDVDGKDIDDYGLNNLLKDSPSDMNEDEMLDVTQVDTSIALEADLHICSSQISVLEEPILSSASDSNPQIDELCREVSICVVSSEDLEVPNNDHVVFPSKPCPPSLNRRGFNEITRGKSFCMGNLHKHASGSDLTLVNRELKIFGELHTDSQARGHIMGLNHTGNHDANLQLQLPKSTDLNANSKYPGTATCSTVIIRTVASENASRKQPYHNLPDFPVKSSDIFLNSKEKQERQPENSLEVNIQSETARETFLSDVEEEASDVDIPSVSDVELVIHDMDLDVGSGDLDSYSSRPVAKYQTDEAKRGIIRLEQSWNASRHRAIASHGAFAYLFGCNRKAYYIKKPEVLLGRATADFAVDIDLGKERRANKISRRQAVIKIDENGEFHLRNLGKCPIEIDGKELHPSQSLILQSNSHIKVRGMDFTFEKNEACVKRYLDTISRTIVPI